MTRDKVPEDAPKSVGSVPTSTARKGNRERFKELGIKIDDLKKDDLICVTTSRSFFVFQLLDNAWSAKLVASSSRTVSESLGIEGGFLIRNIFTVIDEEGRRIGTGAIEKIEILNGTKRLVELVARESLGVINPPQEKIRGVPAEKIWRDNNTFLTKRGAPLLEMLPDEAFLIQTTNRADTILYIVEILGNGYVGRIIATSKGREQEFLREAGYVIFEDDRFSLWRPEDGQKFQSAPIHSIQKLGSDEIASVAQTSQLSVLEGSKADKKGD